MGPERRNHIRNVETPAAGFQPAQEPQDGGGTFKLGHYRQFAATSRGEQKRRRVAALRNAASHRRSEKCRLVFPLDEHR